MAKDKPYHGVSDASVVKATGHDWKYWFKLLDKEGALKLAHGETAALLANKEYIASSWWCQMVTVQYEKERGLRVDHQMVGGFEISVSKTVATSVEKAFGYFNSNAKRVKWLEEELTISTSTPSKSVRAAWGDGTTRINIYFYEKGVDKCQVVAQHLKLKDAKEAEKMKAFWKLKLEKLAGLI